MISVLALAAADIRGCRADRLGVERNGSLGLQGHRGRGRGATLHVQLDLHPSCE